MGDTRTGRTTTAYFGWEIPGGERNQGSNRNLEKPLEPEDILDERFAVVPRSVARAVAMDTLAKYKEEVDKASSTSGKADGRFNIRDIHNLPKTPGTPADLRAAAAYISKDEGLLRDIDGQLTDDGYGHSDGGFSWKDFERARRNARTSGYTYSGYGGHTKAPVVPAIDHPTYQAKEGNCVFHATVTGLAMTPKGKQLLANSIRENDDGSFTVIFPGDARKKEYRIAFADVDGRGNPAYVQSNHARGDIHMHVLSAAADLYFKDNGRKKGVNGLNSNLAADLLTGGEGKHVVVGVLEYRKAEIKKFLAEMAPRIGKDVSLTVSGYAGRDGNMSWRRANHLATVSEIDLKNGVITYLNPWDNTDKKTVRIDVLIDEMSKGSANVHLNAEIFGAVPDGYRVGNPKKATDFDPWK